MGCMSSIINCTTESSQNYKIRHGTTKLDNAKRRCEQVQARSIFIDDWLSIQSSPLDDEFNRGEYMSRLFGMKILSTKSRRHTTHIPRRLRIENSQSHMAGGSCA
jgi:hypothetical protein